MDGRREVNLIFKHLNNYHDMIGEVVIYYVFDPVNSMYDSVYDEGSRRYASGVQLPILWIDQVEAPEGYTAEGRRPTQRCRFSCTTQSLGGVGISVTEVHGNQLHDTSPSDVWRKDRMHDIFYYDDRYYEVSSFGIEGRVKGVDVIVGIAGIETFPNDDMVLDFAPEGVV